MKNATFAYLASMINHGIAVDFSILANDSAFTNCRMWVQDATVTHYCVWAR